MDVQVTMKNLNLCMSELNKATAELKVLGIKKSIAEKAYRIKQAQEILNLKAEKYPATLIMDLVKGNEGVAELRLQRDIAKSEYYNCISKIENLRIKISVIKSDDIKRYCITKFF